MAAQPDNLLLATAPRYCQYYNQLHQLPLVALPLPFDESQQKKLEVPFTLLWQNGTAIIRRSSGYGKPLKTFTRRWHNRIV
ncbi:DNA-binding transcriptional regulator YidZ [Escherichia coli]|nr:DNA-binding transcriptional regulator YidZ [Escherichia coli]